jgi:phosphate-selective porin OprO and OprP
MLPKNSKWLALLSLALASGGVVLAQSADNQALIDLLIKKGVLSDQEAKEITAEVSKSQAAEDVETNNDGFIQKLTLSGRFQTQFVGLGTSIDGTSANPVSTEHFLLRRIYLGTSVTFVDGFSGTVVYDLANDSFDKALLQWKESPMFILQAGIQKAPFGYEENLSSGDLRAIERSEITRYIDEPNNGRRLGAASYRTGVYATGTWNGFFYNVALTNPERNEYSGDSTNTAVLVNGQGGVGSTGGAATNKPAYYGTVGYGGSVVTGGSKVTYKVGYETGFDPDQGGPAATIGTGRNITLNGFYGDLTVAGFELQGEWEQAQDDSGAGNHIDATPNGFWIQPSYRFTPQWEAVVQYSDINSDGRGVALSDVIRSAPSGGTMNKSDEWYFGFNWYIKGNDVKLQAGYIYGESDDTITGKYAKATTNGFRSQMQLQF